MWNERTRALIAIQRHEKCIHFVVCRCRRRCCCCWFFFRSSPFAWHEDSLNSDIERDNVDYLRQSCYIATDSVWKFEICHDLSGAIVYSPRYFRFSSATISSDMLTVFDIFRSFGFYYCTLSTWICWMVVLVTWFFVWSGFFSIFFFSMFRFHHFIISSILSSVRGYYGFSAAVGVVIGPSLAIQSEPALQPISNLADTAYPKQNQYFDSTNMAYVLELSNSKTNQNNGAGDEDDEDDNRSSNDSDNTRTNQKYVNVSSRDNRNFYNNNNHNIGDDADKMNNALNRGPFFDVSASKNVTALVGKTANLNCRIKNLGNKTVSKHRLFAHFTILNDSITSAKLSASYFLFPYSPSLLSLRFSYFPLFLLFLGAIYWHIIVTIFPTHTLYIRFASQSIHIRVFNVQCFDVYWIKSKMLLECLSKFDQLFVLGISCYNHKMFLSLFLCHLSFFAPTRLMNISVCLLLRASVSFFLLLHHIASLRSWSLRIKEKTAANKQRGTASNDIRKTNILKA